MRRLILFFALATGTLLAGCAVPQPRKGAAMPELRLAPSALGRDLALQQRLAFRYGNRVDSVDALLEVDADNVRLVLHRHGQVALRMNWDGHRLDEARAPGVPESLVAARVLSDLQLVLWPADAVRAALPSGWSLRDTERTRELQEQGTRVATVDYFDATHTRLTQARDGYVLEIRSEAP